MRVSPIQRGYIAISLMLFVNGQLLGQMIPRDVQVSLTCIDPLDGHTIWSAPFDRKLRPYRCEGYSNRVVAFLYPLNAVLWNATEVAYLNSRSGQPVTPFDTRDFIYPNEDPQLARSVFGSQGSVREERAELTLENGWTSFGVAGLSWNNYGSNDIYFFKNRKLVWTFTLPNGAYNLVHWKDILVYRQSTEEKNKLVSHLIGQKAGARTRSWDFALPPEIPDRPGGSFDVVGGPATRWLSYAVGTNDIFAFGGGTIFALEPNSGKVRWKHAVKEDAALKKNAEIFDAAELVEISDELLLVSGNSMAGFDKIKKTTVGLLRTDLFDGPLPMKLDNYIYCFTEKP